MSGGRRWLPFLAVAAALHAAALLGVALPARERAAVALDSAPVELSFAAEEAATPAAEPPPPVPGEPPRPAPQPEPMPAPEPRPEPKPEPKPQPEPEPKALPVPEAPQEPREQPMHAEPAPAQPPRVVADVPPPAAQTVATRFRGKPARNARGYFGQLSAWIDANKSYPVECRKDKEQGAVIVKFTIARDGRLLDAAVKTGSGYERLDRAALDTLARAAPFPPIPDFIDRDTLSISVPIEYSLVTE